MGEIEATMSAAEFAEWGAYFRIKPLPDHTWNAAQVCSVVANVNGNKTKAEDFVPKVVVAPASDRPSGELPTAEESAGILGRRFRENEEKARKRIALMGG